MFTNLKVTKIEKLYDSHFLINSRYTVQIQEPIDKEVVNKYYPLLYNIKDQNCTSRITHTHLVVSGIGATVKVYREGDNYELRVSEYYYNGLRELKTKTTTINTTLEGAVLDISELFSWN